jgi:hypothetical protein
MSLSAYSRAAYNTGEDLRDMLREEVYEPLLAGLSLHSPHELHDVRYANRTLVREVATSAPAKRRKALAKLPVETQFWVIAAAAQMAFEAAAVIDAAELRLRPGGPYREMIWDAQMVLEAQYDSPDAEWPFPTRSPFRQAGQDDQTG